MKRNDPLRRDSPADPNGSGPRPAHAADLAPPRPYGDIAAITVGPAELPEHLFRRLLGAYLRGALEFEVRERAGISPATREVVRSFCRRTRQPEVVSDEGGLLRLRDLAYESPVPLAQRLARMGRLVLDFHREALDTWQRLPMGEDGCWERRDDEIDREAWYIQRIASLRLAEGRPGPDLLGAWTIARSLERIADHAVVIGTVGPRLVELPSGAGPATPLRQFHLQAMEHLDGVLRAADPDTVNGLLDTGAALIGSGQSLADRLLPGVGGATMPPATAAAVARILESIGRTIAYSQDIAQVVLDRPVPGLSVPESPTPSRARERFVTPPIP